MLLIPRDADHLPLLLGAKVETPKPPVDTSALTRVAGTAHLYRDTTGRMQYLPPLPPYPRKPYAGPAREASAPVATAHMPTSTVQKAGAPIPAGATHTWHDGREFYRRTPDGGNEVYLNGLWQRGTLDWEAIESYLKPLPGTSQCVQPEADGYGNDPSLATHRWFGTSAPHWLYRKVGGMWLSMNLDGFSSKTWVKAGAAVEQCVTDGRIVPINPEPAEPKPPVLALYGTDMAEAQPWIEGMPPAHYKGWINASKGHRLDWFRYWDGARFLGSGRSFKALSPSAKPPVVTAPEGSHIKRYRLVRPF
jgi:hypothetical protein